MNIAAADLKRALKKLSPIKTESYQIGPHGVSAQDPDALVVESCPLSGLGDTFSTNGKKLSSITGRMSGQIEITRGERSIVLKSSKARVELEIYPTKPLLVPESPDKFLTLCASEFKKALGIAVSSASPNKSAAFGGVVQIQSLPLGIEDEVPSGYRIVGTDSVVLTLVTATQGNVAKGTDPLFEFKTLLNLTAAGVVSLLDGEIIQIGETTKHVQLLSGSTTIYASKPAQAYPDFDRVLNQETKLKFGLNPEELLAAVRTVEPLIEDVDKGAISLLFEDNVVQCKSIGVGNTAQDEAPYVQLVPDPVFEPVRVENLRLNAKYLSGFLSRAGKDATISLIDKTKPVRMESGNVVVLTMPMVTKGVK